MSMTTRDVLDALEARYNKPSQGRESERFVTLHEARSGAGFQGNDGACDFLAINTWRGRGMELLGHEIKVSVSDWRRELEQPDKAERFARHCHRWWVVAPSDVAKVVIDELPEPWGLLSVSDSGRITQRVAAPRTTNPEAVPVWWWVGWLAQIDRQHKRDMPRKIASMLDGERQRIAERAVADAEHMHARRERERQSLDERVTMLAESTGIDLRRAWTGDLRRLAAAWSMLQGPGVPLVELSSHLRNGADAIDRALAVLDDDEAGS